MIRSRAIMFGLVIGSVALASVFLQISTEIGHSAIIAYALLMGGALLVATFDHAALVFNRDATWQGAALQRRIATRRFIFGGALPPLAYAFFLAFTGWLSGLN